MIIELFGLPASGKTTFAGELSKKEGWVIIKIKNRRELVWYNLKFLINNPANFLILFWYALKNMGPTNLIYYKMMNFFFDVNARFEKAKQYPKAVLDQGYFQNILSLFEYVLSERELISYAKIIPKPDEIIILNIPKEERKERVSVRDHFARKNMPESYIQEWNKNTEKNYMLFVNNVNKLDMKFKII